MGKTVWGIRQVLKRVPILHRGQYNNDSMNSIRMTEDFWNRTWIDFEPFQLDPVAFRESAPRRNREFLNLIGEVHQKDVLDIGCGNGLLSVYLAQLGARVTAIDTSPQAVKNTVALAKTNRVDSLVEAHRFNAMELNNLGKSFDIVAGKFILHHIEPFDQFTEILFNMLKKGGRGVFFENNSRNPVLIFFRTFIAGRFGVPKYGDREEFPFEPREIEILKQRFDSVSLYYPEFMFFRLMSPYLFKQNMRLSEILDRIDQWIYRYWSLLHKYSYLQIIRVQKF